MRTFRAEAPTTHGFETVLCVRASEAAEHEKKSIAIMIEELQKQGEQIAALRERQRVLVEALELVIGRSDRLKSALRTIKTDTSFGFNAARLLQSIASLSLLEEAKQTNIDRACRAALAAKEG